jgi:hypothetical protein
MFSRIVVKMEMAAQLQDLVTEGLVGMLVLHIVFVVGKRDIHHKDGQDKREVA